MRDDIFYIYSDHLYGDFFVADEDYENDICPQCGDTDTLEYAGTYDEILSWLKYDIEVTQQKFDAIKGVMDTYIARNCGEWVSPSD